MGKALKNANKDLNQEMVKQTTIIYSSAIIILWKDYGWRKTRIMRRFQTSKEIFDECAAYGTSKSMMQMLEDETGIEIRMNGCDKSFHDLAYLDADKWDGKMPTAAQAVYIKQRMKPWIAPQLLSCLCLTMHRDEKYGPQRIAEFIHKVDEYRIEHGEDVKHYEEALKEITGIDIEEIK